MRDNKDLNYYLAAWNLSNPQLLTQTRTSHIYTVAHQNETVVLKLFAAAETKEQTGALALRYFDGRGAVRLLRYDEGAQLVEYAAGDELVTLVERGEDENATRIIAQVIKQLHSVPQDLPRDGFVALDRWFGELFDKAAADRQAGSESIYVRGAALAERLLADQREMRVLHGDIHHYNIRQVSARLARLRPERFPGWRAHLRLRQHALQPRYARTCPQRSPPADERCNSCRHAGNRAAACAGVYLRLCLPKREWVGTAR